MVCLSLAVGLGVLGAQKTALTAALEGRGEPAEATVVAVEHKAIGVFNSVPKEWTDITVAFNDARGTPVRATRQGRESTTIGGKIGIVYDPRNPTRAGWNGAIDDAQLDWFLSAACLITCLGLLIPGGRAARQSDAAKRGSSRTHS
jgi:hypothetical protein